LKLMNAWPIDSFPSTNAPSERTLEAMNRE
jgi:hypothetical protein